MVTMITANLTRTAPGRWRLDILGASPVTFEAYFTSGAIDAATILIHAETRRTPTWTRIANDTWRAWS